MKKDFLKKCGLLFLTAGMLAFGGSTCNLPGMVMEAKADKYFTEEWELSEDVVIEEDIYLNASLNLNGHTLTVNGNVYHRAGTLNVNGGMLKVTGDYVVQGEARTVAGETVYTNSTGYIQMMDSNDTIEVKGDFIMQSEGSGIRNQFHEGTLYVGGNFYQYNGDEGNFAPYNSFKVVLNGNGTQKVHFDSAKSNVGTLEVVGGDARTINWEGYMHIGKLTEDLMIQTEDLTICKLLMAGKNVTIDGDVLQQGDINPAGATLTIQGDLQQIGGEMNIGGGTVNISGAYKVQGIGSEKGSDGCIVMWDDDDKLNVGGDFIMQSNAGGTRNKLHKGIMTVTGDFYQYNGDEGNFAPYNSFKVILNGNGAQKVHFNGVKSGFGILEVTGGTARTINWEGHMDITGLTQDIMVQGTDIVICELLMDGKNVTINSDVVMQGGVKPEGGILTIKGNLQQIDGNLNVSGGTVNVEGWYMVQGSGSELNSAGNIIMQDSNDKITVNGDFVFRSANSSVSNKFHKGILTIGGNFYQYNGNAQNFVAYNGHKVIMDGQGSREIHFESEKCKFGNLTLMQPTANYKISPEECWASLTEYSDIHAHVWSDYEVTEAATALKAGVKTRFCACGKQETVEIEKLEPTIKVNMKTVPLQVKKSTKALKVTGLATGDKVVSVKSSDTKKLTAKVSSKGVITLKAKKTGTVKLTIKLASGLEYKKVKVKIQTGTVVTKKIKLNVKNQTLKKGATFQLEATLTPLTSSQKITYKSSKPSVVSVNKKGKLTAKKKGNATITVISGSKKATCKIKVN